MRAIKRIRYGEKELQRLKEMVSRTEEKEAKESEVFKKLQSQFTITSMDTDSKTSGVSKEKVTKVLGAIMETDALDESAHKRKTMLNGKGQYPEWMNSRRLKKQKAVVKRLKNKKKK